MFRVLVTAVIVLGLLVDTTAEEQTTIRNPDWPERILVTNDDGFDSPGLHALVGALSAIAEVTVVAPAGNRSGSSSFASVLSGRVVVEARQLDGAVAAYAVSGFPADCVLIGVTGLMADDPPDLVVSGINRSANLADAWAYSGTLGAARVAALQGIPAIAVSGGAADALSSVARWIADLVDTALVRELTPPRYVAIDIPSSPLVDLVGVVVRPRAAGVFRPRVRRGNRGAADIPNQDVWVAGSVARDADNVEGTDVEALSRNLIVITAMRAHEEDAAFLRQLQERATELPSWPPAGDQEREQRP